MRPMSESRTAWLAVVLALGAACTAQGYRKVSLDARAAEVDGPASPGVPGPAPTADAAAAPTTTPPAGGSAGSVGGGAGGRGGVGGSGRPVDAGSMVVSGDAGAGGRPPDAGSMADAAVVNAEPPVFDPVCRPPSPPDSTVVLIDDFEDGDTTATLAGFTATPWTANHDPTAGGQQRPDPFQVTMIESCAGNRGYAHVRGAGFKTWGALMALPFAQATDISMYAGVRFWARLGKGALRTTPVRLRLPDRNTEPSGGTCDMPGPDGTKGCFNNFGRNLDDLGTEWKLITVMFTETTQLPGWGKQIPTGIDVTAVYGVDFYFNGGATYDLWIDDIAFIKK